jgi:hypothetical protein
MTISEIEKEINRICDIFNLHIFYFDTTDHTLICRFGINEDLYIHVYANDKKDKLNLALIVKNDRVYGIDREGGDLHEHPFNEVDKHIPANSIIELEEFILISLQYLKELELI